VLANGRAMDPESNLDAVRQSEFAVAAIAAVSTSPLEARIVVDVKGSGNYRRIHRSAFPRQTPETMPTKRAMVSRRRSKWKPESVL